MIKNETLRRDLYHVMVPVILATVMAPSSLAGSAVFLLAWGVVRAASHV